MRTLVTYPVRDREILIPSQTEIVLEIGAQGYKKAELLNIPAPTRRVA